jgi:hypothetical protein
MSQGKRLPPAPTDKPVGSDWLGRVETPHGLAYHCVCGCGALVLEGEAQVPSFEVMRDRQQGNRVHFTDMWRHAFGPKCIRRHFHGFSLLATQKQASAHPGPRQAPPPKACPSPRSGVGKTERERLKKAVKAGKMTKDEYEIKTGFRL